MKESVISMPILYVVATPIGNLDDITLRGLNVLRDVGLIAAEDTRVTRRLTDRYQIQTPLTSYHEHNKLTKLETLLETLKKQDVALVSDAGTPGISDPGAEFVSAAVRSGFKVVSIPGPSALTSAIAASGFQVDKFTYLGFFPKRRIERRRILESLSNEHGYLVAFESPRRIRETLADVKELFGDSYISISRELSKIHEETFHGLVSQALKYFSNPRGEFTIVIEKRKQLEYPDKLREERARALIVDMRANGRRSKETVTQVMGETGISHRRAYELWLETINTP